jgi:four helix bundle protein
MIGSSGDLKTDLIDRMESKQEQLRARTKKFALRIIRLFQKLPRTPEAQILGKQLLRSGTSVGANYRAAGRARSGAEFSAKIGVVVEEADETVFWLECLVESGYRKARTSWGSNQGSQRIGCNLCCFTSHCPKLKFRSPDGPITR